MNPIPELTDELLPALRQTHAWMISLDAWLQSAKPSEARAVLHNRETFLRTIDRLAWAVMRFVDNMEPTPDAYAEALTQEGPNWEDNASEEEIETEEAHPLTRAERHQLMDTGGEAVDKATKELSLIHI